MGASQDEPDRNEPSRDEVRAMVSALFTLTARLDQARRRKHAAAALDLLQVIAGQDGMRPSDIAGRHGVHRSLVTRQVQALEAAGYVRVAGDPADGRSWLVSLTPAGLAEMLRLQEVGLDRFATFVAGWEPGEVRALAELLDKLRASMSAAGDRGDIRRERPRAGNGLRPRRGADGRGAGSSGADGSRPGDSRPGDSRPGDSGAGDL
jgi:DNA-binding MarR family transcriptional regulator